MEIKKLLIISYFANVDAMAPSHHIDDRIPLFQKLGVTLSLLTSPCGSQYKSVAHRRIPSPAPSGIRFEVRHFLRRKTRKRLWFKFLEFVLLLPVYPLYFIEKIFVRLDSTWSWFITASIAATVLSFKNRPDIIYSTGGPLSAHIAAMVASSFTKVPHIAEFQDPLVHEYAAPGKCERCFMKMVEHSVFKNADASVFLTRQAASNASSRNPGCAKSFSIYAGASPQEHITTYQKGEKFVIAHFGSLGGSRNLGPFLGALEVLFRNDPAIAGEFRLDLYGNNSRAVKREIERFTYRDAVKTYGKVNRTRAVESMRRADVLLLIQNMDDVSFETIPSKVYEYLHTGRPILALVYRNPELRTMLEARGHLVVEADDAAQIEEALKTYIAKWRENHLEGSYVPSPYTVEKAVTELINVAKQQAGELQQ